MRLGGINLRPIDLKQRGTPYFPIFEEIYIANPISKFFKMKKMSLGMTNWKQRGTPYFSLFEEIYIVNPLLKFIKMKKTRVFEFGDESPHLWLKLKGYPLFFYIWRKSYSKSPIKIHKNGEEKSFWVWEINLHPFLNYRKIRGYLYSKSHIKIHKNGEENSFEFMGINLPLSLQLKTKGYPLFFSIWRNLYSKSPIKIHKNEEDTSFWVWGINLPTFD